MQITVSTDELVGYEKAMQEWLIRRHRENVVVYYENILGRYNIEIDWDGFEAKAIAWEKKNPRPRLIPDV